MVISPTALNYWQRRSIGYLASGNSGALINMPNVGPKTIDALIALGLVDVAPLDLPDVPRYRLTKAGDDMYEELSRLNLIPR